MSTSMYVFIVMETMGGLDEIEAYEDLHDAKAAFEAFGIEHMDEFDIEDYRLEPNSNDFELWEQTPDFIFTVQRVEVQ